MMKKSLLALAALGAFASAAQAESSVALFGIIDTGVNYTNNVQVADGVGRSQVNLASGVMQGSRWGLRGSQDLDGNGLKAVFMLENGFDINTGRQSQGFNYFGRQAYVGIGGDFGTVTVGRQYDSINDFVSPLTANGRWEGSVAAHPGDIDNLNGTQRINNAIKYSSNSYDGLSFGGLYSLGGIAGRRGQNQIWSVGAGYANGPIALGAAYSNVKNPNDSLYGNNPFDAKGNPVGTGANHLADNPIYGRYATAKSLEIAAVGGTFTVDQLTIGAAYTNTRFKGVSETKDTKNVTFQNAEASLAYQFSPVLVGMASYDYTWAKKVDGQSAAKYQQATLGLDYLLSKSVDVYVLGAYQKAQGTNANGKPAVAMIGLNPSSTSKQAFGRVGLRVKF